MNDWKDKYKGLNQGFEKKFDFNPLRLDLAMHNGTTPCYSYYDKEVKERKFFSGSVEGFVIGSCMQASSFDQNLNKVAYSTDYYFTKDNVVAYDSNRNKAFTGSKSDFEVFCIQNNSAKPSVKKIVFLLNEKGIIAVKTNIGCYIEQQQLVNDHWLTHTIKLTPARFSETDNRLPGYWSTLNKVAQEKPPMYAFMELSKELTEEHMNKIKAPYYTDEYEKFREAKGYIDRTSKVTDQSSTPPVNPPVNSNELSSVIDFQMGQQNTPPSIPDSYNNLESDVDDLPF